jgi:glycosyltransferase involved in cell wall biosynthesis
MLKAADALHEAGFDVRVVSASHTPWAVEADKKLRATRRWRWDLVDYAKATARGRQIVTGARRRIAHALTVRFGASRAPAALCVRSYSRARRARACRDLLPGTDRSRLRRDDWCARSRARGGCRLGVPCGLDLGDFHTGERSAQVAQFSTIAERVERLVLPGAAFLTTSSPMIADAYTEKYGLRPRTIHNTFSLDLSNPVESLDGVPLRFYWFSQTLGAGRGLEDFIRAAALAKVVAELHLRAGVTQPYLDDLMRYARDAAPTLTFKLHEPGSPDAMVHLSRGYDLGLSGEEPSALNRRMCLGNKIFTYLAAGVPVLLSATPAQTLLGQDLGKASIMYQSGDVAGLAERLACLARDPGARVQARKAARQAALRRWHWEHPADRGALIDVVSRALPDGRK